MESLDLAALKITSLIMVTTFNYYYRTLGRLIIRSFAFIRCFAALSLHALICFSNCLKAKFSRYCWAG
ncbi:hypothetical protein HYPGJ_20109 [Hyphomicrobium sp. GJ21]|nr:hypothetical protein HYPGJ_20109 [Hyphomicrobium sp. GJ21]